MDLVVYDDDEKRYVPWAVALAAVLLVALLTAGLTFLLASQASGAEEAQPVRGVSTPAPATSPTPDSQPTAASAPTSAPDCAEAMTRADAALTRAETVEQALADHTAIMDELLAERISTEQALDRALPVLTDGATARRQLEQALGAYREAREQCSA